MECNAAGFADCDAGVAMPGIIVGAAVGAAGIAAGVRERVPMRACAWASRPTNTMAAPAKPQPNADFPPPDSNALLPSSKRQMSRSDNLRRQRPTNTIMNFLYHIILLCGGIEIERALVVPKTHNGRPIGG